MVKVSFKNLIYDFYKGKVLSESDFVALLYHYLLYELNQRGNTNYFKIHLEQFFKKFRIRPDITIFNNKNILLGIIEVKFFSKPSILHSELIKLKKYQVRDTECKIFLLSIDSIKDITFNNEQIIIIRHITEKIDKILKMESKFYCVKCKKMLKHGEFTYLRKIKNGNHYSLVTYCPYCKISFNRIISSEVYYEF